MKELVLTTERVIPKAMNPRNGMLQEHIARYIFANNIVHGKVLDLACGVGYAVPILFDIPTVSRVKQYVGVDIDKKCIEYAKVHYSHPKAEFITGDACDTSLIEQLGSFDYVISFETIEHLEKDSDFIRNIITLLKPGGTALISTPFGRGRDIECSNPYHVCQYTEEDFKDLLTPFKKVKMYHQIDEYIEEPLPEKKYYLMLAVCTI